MTISNENCMLQPNICRKNEQSRAIAATNASYRIKRKIYDCAIYLQNNASKYNRTVPAHILHTGATVHLWRATVHRRATVHPWVKVHLVSKFSTL